MVTMSHGMAASRPWKSNRLVDVRPMLARQKSRLPKRTAATTNAVVMESDLNYSSCVQAGFSPLFVRVAKARGFVRGSKHENQDHPLQRPVNDKTIFLTLTCPFSVLAARD
jgi:hypothetical protein